MSPATARALWIASPGQAELRDSAVDDVSGEVRIQALFSGISRGTERLVFHGQVPPDEFDTMRAPFQDGSFAFPIKYGYASVGVVQDGARAGETVFALYPHQSAYCVPDQAALAVPGDVPAKRAVLAANMETALNVVWDAAVAPGDRLCVIGAGVIGALTGYLCAQIPGTEVHLVDIDPTRATLAKALGCGFTAPETAPTEADVVIHATASSDGLTTAINAAGIEATIAEASWYGARNTTVPLGAAFHRKRLRLVSSQVGRIPPHHAPRWTYRRRLQKALALLADPALDHLISGETAFDALPDAYGDILSDPQTLCHRVAYG